VTRIVTAPTKPDPFTVSKKEAFEIVGMVRLVQRWLHATRHATRPEDKWVIIVLEGGPGRETRIDFSSLQEAYRRFLNGEQPPLLPCERGKGKAS
jgi:hypothetical protein